MASIVERKKVDGASTYQVRWRNGGGRGGKVETENFATQDEADQFKELVNAHRQRWPHGWVRGRGFVEEPDAPDDPLLVEWALRYVSRITGVTERVRQDYEREVHSYFSLLKHTSRSGVVSPATVGNVTAEDVVDWVRLQERGEQDPADPEKWIRKKAHPKTIKNRHALLFGVFQAAVQVEPPMRTRNPCAGTKLPRLDISTEDRMCFLEREEYARIRAEVTDPHAGDLLDWLVGSGTRWGEAAALQVQDLRLNGAAPTAAIHRAWKRAPKGSDKMYYLGPPKTKKARRLIRLSPSQVEMLRRRVTGLEPEDFVFRTKNGRLWEHSNFYSRKWVPAVNKAVAKGLPKRPRLHDLRHTHVSWLIAERIPLPAIQARLGHESITTTVDRYGHLLQSLDDEISGAVEALMAVPVQQGLRVVREA
ncbi:tyrosine-type recombinase/integrase [Streptomyces triculaminicus]|uniref:tyrosine-type recombinase/integrase n=1 Tax=Streptomyces triculaminicus TaxID=2816232 RepID=UPI0037A45F1C